MEGLEFAGLEIKEVEGKTIVMAVRRKGMRECCKGAVCFAYDSLLQTLQVLFSLLMALMQESVGDSHRINRQITVYSSELFITDSAETQKPEDINAKQIVVCS